MTSVELSKYDGQNGQPAYVAVSGSIYDVTASERWQNGLHEGVHQAGQDLTEALKSAPHVRAVIERFPVVGRLEEPAAEQTTAKRLPLPLLIGGAVALLVVIALLMR
jgi:predicted heme/steroid binding protein